MKLLSLASRFAPDLLCFEQPAETRNRVALTFDDGPHPEYTPRILEILGKLEGRATFFFQGLNAARWPELVRRAHAAGHQIAAHGVDHVAASTQPSRVAADNAIPTGIRDIARLRAALLLVDHGSYADVSSRIEALTADTNPLRHSAREALGLAAWKDGKSADALKLFDQISSDDAAPRNVRQRAQLMSELIRGSGNAS